MPRGSGMPPTRRRRQKPVKRFPTLGVADYFKACLGWEASDRPFNTTANRQCGACKAIKPGSEFDRPITPGKPRLNTCRDC